MTEMPFGFTWCYNDVYYGTRCLVLLIDDPEDVPPLYIDISNILSDKTISISPIPGVSQPDASNYHYKLAFLPGILANPGAIAVESADWSISSVSDADGDSIYLLWTGTEKDLAPQDIMSVILTGVAVQSLRMRTNTTAVNISWQFAQGGIEVMSMERIPDVGDYDENTTLTLNMVSSTQQHNISLYAGFVNCNKVLNTYD